MHTGVLKKSHVSTELFVLMERTMEISPGLSITGTRILRVMSLNHLVLAIFEMTSLALETRLVKL